MTAAQTVAQIAAEQFRTRQTRARTIVRNRGMSIAQAERHLRPWLAIACLAGATLPEIDRAIADVRDVSAASKTPLSPGELQWLAAEEICPRTAWVPVLAAARDAAFDRFGTHGDDAALALGAALQRICLALQHDVNGNHIPYYTPPEARARQAAA